MRLVLGVGFNIIDASSADRRRQLHQQAFYTHFNQLLKLHLNTDALRSLRKHKRV